MKKPKLNVKLLRQVAKHIKAEPHRYVQYDWVRPDSDSPCGTQACIAGWAVLLNTKPERWKKFYYILSNWDRAKRFKEKARKIVGITKEEASELFGNNQIHSSGTQGVREACKKIDKLIAERRSGGWTR